MTGWREITNSSYKLLDRRDEIENQFSSLADYIWKLPRLIERERKREEEALFEYFPDSTDPKEHQLNVKLRALRFYHEFSKLDFEFPIFMGTSSLIQVISLFEFRLFQLCKDFAKASSDDLNAFRGKNRGASRLLDYIVSMNRLQSRVEGIEQINCAIEMRNCLAHANGFLGHAKNDNQIRKIIISELYFPSAKRGMKPDPEFDIKPRLISVGSDDFLYCPVLYSHFLSSLARKCLLELYSKSVATLSR